MITLEPNASDILGAEKTLKLVQVHKRRVRWLAGLAIILWTLASVSGLLFVAFFFVFIYPKIVYMMNDNKMDQMRDAWLILGDWGFNWLIATGVLGMLAGICTVLLILASNQASMIQLHATLSDISEKLRKLQSPPPRELLP